jgi:polyisoprenyl-phosphate glycosyltransferase
VNDFDANKNIIISCIIPAYNEEKNISRVMDAATTFSGFNEILVIDDGSQDSTTRIAESYQANCPALKVITLPQKNGKAGVIKRGITGAKGSLIVTLDADLIGLTHKNIDSLILPVINGEVDQTVMDRAGDHTPVWGWTNCAKYFGGERAFWKKDFLEIDMPDSSGYLLEIINNLHYIKRGKIIRTIFCRNLYTVHQFNKMDMITGTKNYIAMSIDILKKATVPGFIKQFFWIENHNMYRLFRFYRNHPQSRPVSGLIIVILHIADGLSLFLLLNVLKIIKLPLKLMNYFVDKGSSLKQP